MQCFAKGYSSWHTVLAIRDWNTYNRAPSDPLGIASTVARLYGSWSNEDGLPQTDRYLHFSQHWGAKVKDREWIIPGVLPARQRCALVGRWGLGKSWLATHIAACVAYGLPFLGDTQPSLRGSVVILDGEGGKLRFLRRMDSLTKGLVSDPPRDDGCDVHWRAAGGLGMGWGENQSALFHELERLTPALIIFDTMAKVIGVSDENSNASAAVVTGAMNALTDDLDAALLLLAHPAKSESGDTTVRGAGEFTADVDVLHAIRRGESLVRMVECHKDRDGDLENRTFAFSIESHQEGTRLVRRRPGPVRDRVETAIVDALEATDGGMTRGQLCQTVQSLGLGGKTRTRERICRMLEAGSLQEDGRRVVTCR